MGRFLGKPYRVTINVAFTQKRLHPRKISNLPQPFLPSRGITQ